MIQKKKPSCNNTATNWKACNRDYADCGQVPAPVLNSRFRAERGASRWGACRRLLDRFIGVLFPVVVFCGCGEADGPGADGQAVEATILQSLALTKDRSDQSILSAVVRDLNCISQKEIGRSLVFASQYKSNDSTQILVVPFHSLLGDLSSCAYSDIGNRYILLSPSLLRAFNQKATLNDTTSLPAVVSLVLLHEMGHFALHTEGAFDRIEPEGQRLGQEKMNTEPEYLTLCKRTELAADSLSASWIKRYFMDAKDPACFGVAATVQTVLPGMEFQLFGLRRLSEFGSRTPNLLRDPSLTHPNLELRIAFMNYYVSGLPEQKQMIDDYLYEREVAPIHRQETDPRIYQGLEKQLPEDLGQEP